MADEKISAMPAAALVQGNDLIPIVRLGTPNQNYSATITQIAAFSPTNVFHEGGGPYVLPTSPVLNQEVWVVDDSGTPGTVVSTADGSLINGQTTFAQYHNPYASYSFVWNGTGWRVK